jgi:DNA-binding response OmpR family regulator
MKVLVLEDDPVCSRYVCTLLQKWGHQVESAGDGRSARMLLKKSGMPDLIILDRVLPDMDGRDFCEEFRHIHPNAPVYIICLTSKDRLEDIVDGFESGADDYLTKPIRPGELSTHLALGKRALFGNSEQRSER